jgi:hypothetical protein
MVSNRERKMISSNSSIDFISVLKTQGVDPMTHMQSQEFRDWLDDYLSENTITVQFTKKDGSDRTMKCTRNFEAIPTDKQPKGTLEKSSTDAIRVFDTDINEWRSFNISNLKRLEY